MFEPEMTHADNNTMITIEVLIEAVQMQNVKLTCHCDFVFVPLDDVMDEPLAFMVAADFNASMLQCLNDAIVTNRNLIHHINEHFVAKTLERQRRCCRELFLQRRSVAGDPIVIEKMAANLPDPGRRTNHGCYIMRLGVGLPLLFNSSSPYEKPAENDC